MGCSFKEFLEYPPDWIEAFAEEIKEVAEDKKSVIHLFELFVARGINRAFGGFK